MVRTALYEAANVLLSRITRFSKLKRWGIDVAKRRYIDARPLATNSLKSSCNARPDHTYGSCASIWLCRGHVPSTPLTADLKASASFGRKGQEGDIYLSEEMAPLFRSRRLHSLPLRKRAAGTQANAGANRN